MRRERYLSGESVRRDHVGVIWGESRPAATISLVIRMYRRGEKEKKEIKEEKRRKKYK